MDQSQKHYTERNKPTQKTTYHMVPFIWNSRTGKTNPWWKNQNNNVSMSMG